MTELQTRIVALQKKHADRKLPLPFADISDSFKVKWLEPDPKGFTKFDELDDVKRQLANRLPIGKADGQCVMVSTKAPHPVSVFMEDFWPLADDLETFFSSVLLAKGQKSEPHLLEIANTQAESKIDKNKPADALKLLRPLLQKYLTPPDPEREDTSDLEDLVAVGWLNLGRAAHDAGDDALSLIAYQHSYAWGEIVAAANTLLLLLDAKRFDDAVQLAQALLKQHTRKIAIDDEANIRSRLILALLNQGKEKAAKAVLEKWRPKSDKAEHREQKKSLVSNFEDTPFEAHAVSLGKLLR